MKYLILILHVLCFSPTALGQSTKYPPSGGGGGGGVSSVSASSPLSVTSPTTTPAITLNTVPISKGGTNSTTALSGNRFVVSSGGAIIEASAVATGAAVVTNGSGLPTSSSTTATELGYVHGVTSAIQTQIAPLATASAAAVVSTLAERDSAGKSAFSTVEANFVQVDSNDGTHHVQISAPATMTTNGAFFLPASQGSVGAVLTSGGAAPMTWGSAGISTATLNTTLSQQTGHRRANIICLTQTTLNGSQTCDGTTTPTSAVVFVAGQTDPTENGLYLESDFGDWVRTGDVPSISALTESVIAVDSLGGGTGYSNTVWSTQSDGSSTFTVDRVPHGCTAQNHACTSATTCAVTCSTAVNTPVMNGGGCKATALSGGDSYPSADTTWTCDYATSTNITAYAICCN